LFLLPFLEKEKTMSSATLPSAYANTPPNVSVETNAREAAAYASTHNIYDNYAWFRDQVQNKGAWDYKQQGSQYEGLGNFNYGATGTAMGIPEQVLLRMAGYAQTKAGTSADDWGTPYGSPPYGDDPLDQQAIMDGIKWANDNGLTPSSLGRIDDYIYRTPHDYPYWENLMDKIFDRLGGTLKEINDYLNDLYLRARAWILPRDPLALDLDGDGLETVGIDGYNTVLFDHDGDGIRTGTGWVKSDDGLLVLDRNGNGQIDGGSELFGSDTVKADGQKAVSGLDALVDLDSNGDGVFDQNDAQFANVRIWQDKDQDGMTDDGELTTLAERGIVSIDLNGQTQNKNLGNGNTQTAVTTFTREDGTTGEAANLNLAENAFYREFTQATTRSDAADIALCCLPPGATTKDIDALYSDARLTTSAAGAVRLLGACRVHADEAANDGDFADGHVVRRGVA
jgi:hypothetical protein